MEITITKKQKNELLKRSEVEGIIKFEGTTPSNNDLAQKLNEDVSLVVVKNIYTNFGLQKATFKALIYDTQESKNNVEKKTKHLRKKAEENAKKAEEERKASEEAAAKEAEASAVEEKTEEVGETA